VGAKIFALSSLLKWENGSPSINLKCNPERALKLREQYDAIQPGYHASKIHWNTVAVNQLVSDVLIKELIDHSYELIFNSLTVKLKQEIQELDN
jgi:predicted DNA-binding protein (MmcQ/YjbR family)